MIVYGVLVIVLLVIVDVLILRSLTGGVPFPERPNPRHIFRIVRRDERAVYVRIMRRTLAIQMRDLNRAIDRSFRAIGKALLPTIQRAAAALEEAFGKRA